MHCEISHFAEFFFFFSRDGAAANRYYPYYNHHRTCTQLLVADLLPLLSFIRIIDMSMCQDLHTCIFLSLSRGREHDLDFGVGERERERNRYGGVQDKWFVSSFSVIA